jgi:hypothetical protein
MLRTIKILGVLALAAGFVPLRAAQQAVSATSAGNPSAVPATEKLKVFISNLPGDETRHIIGTFAGGTSQPYNTLYAVLENSGLYDPQLDPARADFIFELRYTCDVRVGYSPNRRGTEEPKDAYFDYLPQVELAVVERKTGTVLGKFTFPIDPAILGSHQRTNLAVAMTGLVDKAGPVLRQPSTELTPPVQIKNAPLPSLIKAANRVYISRITGDPAKNAKEDDLLYNEMNKSMTKWARYQLVATPADADMVLALGRGDGTIQLQLQSPGSPVVLWPFTVHTGDMQDKAETLVKNLRDLLAKADKGT